MIASVQLSWIYHLFFMKLNVLDILHDAIRIKKNKQLYSKKQNSIVFFKRIPKQWRFKHLYIKNSGTFVWKDILLSFGLEINFHIHGFNLIDKLFSTL